MTATIEDPRPYVDPGHVLPDEDWAKVVKRAREIREEVQEDAEGGASGPGGIILDMTAMGVASRKYFPPSGIPTQLLVLHSAECPLRGGYAKSLSEWACSTVYPAPPIASWQRFVDPIHRVRLIPDELGAWHASEANVMSIGWEQAGYARYSRAEWLTPDGLTQLEMLALDMAEVALRDGIPARWLTTAEVTAATNGNRSVKGFCTHRQIDPETRTDPGDGYPYELLMERIIFFMGGGAVNYSGATEADVFTTEDKDWIGNKLYEVIQDPVVKEALRGHIMNNTTLVNIQAAIVPPILKSAAGHAKALFDAIVAQDGVDGDALAPLFEEHLRRIAAIRYELTPVAETVPEASDGTA